MGGATVIIIHFAALLIRTKKNPHFILASGSFNCRW